MIAQARDLEESPLLETLTEGYAQSLMVEAFTPVRRPPFRRYRDIPMMLQHPTVQLALSFIVGPIISRAKFKVTCSNPRVQNYLCKQINNFWNHSADLALQFIEWGYYCAESIYDTHDGYIHFDCLKNLHPRDCECETLDDEIVGARIRNTGGGRGKVYLGGAKNFWVVHRPAYNTYYGMSQLFGSYGPWFEAVTQHGYHDTRVLYFRKYAMSGDILYGPQGTYKDANGLTRRHEEDGRKALERRMAGGVMYLPNTMMPDGKTRAWEYSQGGTGGTAAVGVLEYGDRIDNEIFRGAQIPPEVVEAQGQGAFAGRVVPLVSYYCFLHLIACEAIYGFKKRQLENLVRLNFEETDFDVSVEGLKLDDSEAAGGELPSPEPLTPNPTPAEAT